MIHTQSNIYALNLGIWVLAIDYSVEYWAEMGFDTSEPNQFREVCRKILLDTSPTKWIELERAMPGNAMFRTIEAWTAEIFDERSLWRKLYLFESLTLARIAVKCNPELSQKIRSTLMDLRERWDASPLIKELEEIPAMSASDAAILYAGGLFLTESETACAMASTILSACCVFQIKASISSLIVDHPELLQMESN
jgi:hypothetical protein